MKTALLFLWLSALAIHASAVDVPPPPQSLPKRQPARITAVATAEDKRTLVIRYEIAGVASEERVSFANQIAEFRYCPWMGDAGIAVVARTGGTGPAEASFSEDGKRVRLSSTRTGTVETTNLWDSRTGAKIATEYFYCTLYFSGSPKEHKPSRIPAPEVVNPVLGIGNSGGDSIVITAVQHRCTPTESVFGWVYIDNCPVPDSGLALGHLTPFTVPAERPPAK